MELQRFLNSQSVIREMRGRGEGRRRAGTERRGRKEGEWGSELTRRGGGGEQIVEKDTSMSLFHQLPHA